MATIDRRAPAATYLTVDEARRIALGIARLPDLLAASTEGPRITEAPDQPETTQ
jgi:hypothetical protein